MLDKSVKVWGLILDRVVCEDASYIVLDIMILSLERGQKV